MQISVEMGGKAEEGEGEEGNKAEKDVSLDSLPSVFLSFISCSEIYLIPFSSIFQFSSRFS